MSIWKSAVRSLPSRWWELATAIVGVALGVAAITASVGLGGLVRTSADGVLAVMEADLAIVPLGSLSAPDAVPNPPLLSAAVIAQIADIPGIVSVDGVVRGTRLLPVSMDGRVLDAALVPTLSGTGDGLAVTSGRAPSGADEVALDETTLARSGHKIGSSILLARPGPGDPIRARITGTIRQADGDPIAYAMFSTVGARAHFLGGADGFNAATVTLAQDADVGGIKDAIRGAIPTTYESVGANDISNAAKFRLYPRLLAAEAIIWALTIAALAGAAILISATVVSLTASAHAWAGGLRRLGASRFQVRAPLLCEAALVGVIGALLGLLVGESVAGRINDAGWGIGLPLGLEVPPLSGPARWVCLGIGVGLALFAALRHASTTAFLSPVDSREPFEAPRFRFGDLTWTSIGLGLIALGLFAAIRLVPAIPAPLAWAGIAAVLLVASAAFASPALAAVPVATLGALLAGPTRGISRLTARNVTRWPTRFTKSVTALVLVSATLAALAVLGASGRASALQQGPSRLHADLVVTSRTSGGFSRDFMGQISQLPGVASVSSLGTATALFDGDAVTLWTADPGGLAQMTSYEVTVGREIRGADEVLVREGSTIARRVTRGDSVKVLINQERAELRVVGVFRAALDGPGLLTSRETLSSRGFPENDALVAVHLGPGVAETAMRGRVAALLQPDPLLRVQTPAESATPLASLQAATDKLADTLGFPMFALATLGLAGTLLLAQEKRKPELRALTLVGMTQDWIIWTIAGEALLSGVMGALIGTLAGAVAAVGMLPVLLDLGFTTRAIPWGTLLGLVLTGVVVGLASAVAPVIAAVLQLGGLDGRLGRSRRQVYAGSHTGERHRGAESAGTAADPQT